MSSLETELLVACSEGNLQRVAECLNKGANMNKVCSNGRTSLGVAAQIGNVDLLTLFLKKMSDCNLSFNTKCSSSNTDGSSNLGYFVVVHNEPVNQNECSVIKQPKIHRDEDNIEYNSLYRESHSCMDVENTYDEEVSTPDGMDNLEWDAEIDIDGDITPTGNDPWSNLYLWYAKILSETAALLDEHPPPDDIDGEDQFGCAALHYAAIEGHKDAISLLIRAGCNVNIEDSHNYSPLHLAASKNRPEIVDLLLQHGANVNHPTPEGVTPLHIAAIKGMLNNAKSLVAEGANVNSLDRVERSPLYAAVSRQQYSLVDFLIEEGALVNLEDMHGFTPLLEAVKRKDVLLVKRLLSAGAKITQSHYLLHYAVLHRQEDMVRTLIRAGCIINLRDENGDTPLMLAVQANSSNIVRILLQNDAAMYYTSTITGQTALNYAVGHLRGNCEEFKKCFSEFEENGWDLDMERSILGLAIAANCHAAATIIRHWDVVSDEDLPKRSEMLTLLLIRENKTLVNLLVLSGFNLRTFHPTEVVLPLPHWFLNFYQNPFTLKELARISVRKALKKRIDIKLRYLNVPPSVKSYIKLEEISCPCEISS